MPEKEKSFLDPLLNPVTNFLAKMSPGVPGTMAKAFQPAVKAGRRAQLRGPAVESKEVTPTKKTPTAKPSASKPSTLKPSKPSSSAKSMKNFAIGSQERRDEYTRRGWAQDATTELSKPNTTANTAKTAVMATTPGAISANVKSVDTGLSSSTPDAFRQMRGTNPLEEKQPGIKATKMAKPKSRKEMRKERRVARLEKRQAIQKEKGKLALSEGRTMDAKQKRYRYNRLQERIDRNKKK